jgi:hypothetical protein
LIIAGAAVAFVAGIAAARGTGLDPTLRIVLIVLVIVGTMFARLTVAVDAGTLQVSFAPGWPRWRWPLREFASARPVRNSWLAGWGIHWMPGFPGYWVINVSGFAAVEFRLRNGRRYRVGTDDPEGLLAALRQASVAVTEKDSSN